MQQFMVTGIDTCGCVACLVAPAGSKVEGLMDSGSDPYQQSLLSEAMQQVTWSAGCGTSPGLSSVQQGFPRQRIRTSRRQGRRPLPSLCPTLSYEEPSVEFVCRASQQAAAVQQDEGQQQEGNGRGTTQELVSIVQFHPLQPAQFSEDRLSFSEQRRHTHTHPLLDRNANAAPHQRLRGVCCSLFGITLATAVASVAEFIHGEGTVDNENAAAASPCTPPCTQMVLDEYWEIAGNHAVGMWGRTDTGFANLPSVKDLIFVMSRLQIKMHQYPR
eukprot:scaffold40428_cov18-Tisochrysis_lutea.AAC.1